MTRIVLFTLVLFFTAPAFAACIAPAGTRADIVYNTNFNMLQYCDGAQWIAMGPVGETGTGGDSFSAIDAGGFYTCAIHAGNAWCWGAGSSGQLGNGDTANQLTPAAVSTAGVGGTAWTALALDNLHTCGIRDDGTAWCWGAGNFGKLGNGGTANQLTPAAVSTAGVGGTAWTVIATGANHTCGIRDDGTAWCWGAGSGGKLGNGINNNQTTPVAVDATGVSGTAWTALALGGGHTCGIRDDGTAWCWGNGGNGRLGTGDTAGQSTPAAVSTAGVGGTAWTVIATGAMHSCGIRDDGTAWCWGDAGQGHLGNGDINDRLTPERVKTDTGGPGWSDWTAINAHTVLTNGHTCGLRADGTAWCWGNGGSGKLGYGGTANQLTPAAVDSSGVSGTAWTMIAAGRTHTCALRDDGAAWCWGVGTSGELGNNDTANQLTPVRPHDVCANPADVAGIMLYNNSYDVMQFCAGGKWLAMGPVPGAGGAGCSLPDGVAGVIVYNNTYNVMQYCDGANWVEIGTKPPLPKYVFVTSGTYDGDLVAAATGLGYGGSDGVEAADYVCQYHADNASPPLTGTYKAWIVDDDFDNAPAIRFTKNYGNYRLPDGTVVANGWDDLTDASLDNALNKDESGAAVGLTNEVWTNVMTDGTRQPFVSRTCTNWTDNTLFNTGSKGRRNLTDWQWTSVGTRDCSLGTHLYCFEQ